MGDKSDSQQSSRFEILVGLHVIDDPTYDQYRAGMIPILEEHGGYFRYDLLVSEMIKGEADDPYNRVFIISFPDEDTKDQFFGDEAYKQVRAEHFDASVKSGGIIASYAVS